MSYVYWTEVDKKEKVVRVDSNVCYSRIFNRGVDEKAAYMYCYEPNLLHPQENEKWIEVMNEMGFPISIVDFKDVPGEKEEKDHKFAWKIDLSKYENKPHLCSGLTLLRYLFEEGYTNQNCVKYFFKIKESLEKDGIPATNLEILQMAHVVCGYGDGHSCQRSPDHQFLTKGELMVAFANRKSKLTSDVSPQIQVCWDTTNPVQLDDKKNYKEMYKIMKEGYKTKVFVVGGWLDYANWLPNSEVVDSLQKADVVLFTGGEDVDPSLYGEQPHPYTQSNIDRDNDEKKIFLEAQRASKKMLGICRGSQFLCVMSGGKLVQHQYNPGTHMMQTIAGEFKTSSTHHQAQYPFGLKGWQYKILGWTEGISDYHYGRDGQELAPAKECEIVYYRDTNCLGIQGHPEFKDFQKGNKKSMDFFKSIYSQFVNGQL